MSKAARLQTLPLAMPVEARWGSELLPTNSSKKVPSPSHRCVRGDLGESQDFHLLPTPAIRGSHVGRSNTGHLSQPGRHRWGPTGKPELPPQSEVIRSTIHRAVSGAWVGDLGDEAALPLAYCCSVRGTQLKQKE